MPKVAATDRPSLTVDNDPNLHLPHDVDTFDNEAEIDFDALKAAITRLESELGTVRAVLPALVEELGVQRQTTCSKTAVQLFINAFRAIYRRS